MWMRAQIGMRRKCFPPPHLILLISRVLLIKSYTGVVEGGRISGRWSFALKRIGGLGEMKYFWNTAGVKDNIIKLNWVASLYTWRVSLKSKQIRLYQMIILISYALKYYIVLKIYPPEKWVRWHLLTI